MEVEWVGLNPDALAHIRTPDVDPLLLGTQKLIELQPDIGCMTNGLHHQQNARRATLELLQVADLQKPEATVGFHR